MKNKLVVVALALLAWLTFTAAGPMAFSQGTAFTYQGRLNDGANLANGIYDLQFAIYDSTNLPGTMVSGPVTNSATQISNGLFTVSLDFGANVFNGADRWLDISVRSNGVPGFAHLNLRQQFTSTPYAITAGGVSGSVSAAQLSGSIAPANIGAGTINSTMLAAGSVTATTLADGSVGLNKLNTTTSWIFSRLLLEPTPAAGDFFGFEMAALGTDRILIGASWDDRSVSAEGGAYLFNANGTLLTSFTNPAPVVQDLFGLAVNTVGDKILISSLDAGANGTGEVYLFNTNGALLKTFANPTPETNDNFGYSVAGVDVDKVIIGSHYDNTGAPQAGAAYLFNTNGTLLTTFTNPTPAFNDQFGHAVTAVGTNLVLITSVADDTMAVNSGAVYLYNLNGGLLHSFFNPGASNLILFGYAITALGNDRVLVGAPDAAGIGTNRSAAYLFNTNGTLLRTFPNQNPTGADLFGSSVAAFGQDQILVGAGLGTTNVVYLFSTNGTLLSTFTEPVPTPGDQFGFQIAALGTNKVVVGAYENNTGAPGAGAAFLFEISAPYVPGLISQGVTDGSITAASLGNVAIDSSKIVDGSIATVDLADGAVNDAKISGVDASKITTGALSDLRLSLNIPRLDGSQTFTGQNSMNNAANIFSGDGSGLTGLSAGNVSSGILADARLSANIARLGGSQTFTGANALNNAANSFSGNGAGLTSLSASSISSGTLSAARLPGNAALLDANQTFTGTNIFNNSGVTIGAASGLSFGTQTRQMLNLWGTQYGIGVQSYTLYFRTDNSFPGGGFAWYQGGVHADMPPGNPGVGGKTLMLLDGTGSLHVTNNVYAGNVMLTSDRHVKENFSALDAQSVLDRVAALPITRWNFIQDPGTAHIGPMAQDFRAAFGVGEDDKHIAVVDEGGVALAAIQGLNEKVDGGRQKEEGRIQKLEAENAELKARLEKLERMMESKHAGAE